VAEELGQASTSEPPVVLLVDDEQSVRSLLVIALTGAGYQVLPAGDGPDALALAEKAERLDLVLTDVLLPTWRGPALVARLRALRPGLKALFLSGATASVILQEGGLAGEPFLGKPFRVAEMLAKVAEVLES
jgi:CheY-like chemotaxis protein